MISIIIYCCNNIIRSLRRAFSVIIHCSDGWDRTSQVAALVQLMTIEHYRTIEGFAQLFEKEFVRYTHYIKEQATISLSDMDLR